MPEAARSWSFLSDVPYLESESSMPQSERRILGLEAMGEISPLPARLCPCGVSVSAMGDCPE